ncbi:MAG: hypothetical protein U9R72_11275 [Chloroflexota bacterium]|nr:hypothetical protein [Chloroflexota bacterium]
MTAVGFLASAYRTHVRQREALRASLSELEEENTSLRARLDREEQAARAKLLVALRRWWWSIHDYEISCGAMGSASEHGVVPSTSDIGIQLENFSDVRTTVWMFLKPETKRVIEETERVFLGFIARIYSTVYGHETYGDDVPPQVMRNQAIAEIIGSPTVRRHTFADCREAFAQAEDFLSEANT